MIVNPFLCIKPPYFLSLIHWASLQRTGSNRFKSRNKIPTGIINKKNTAMLQTAAVFLQISLIFFSFLLHKIKRRRIVEKLLLCTDAIIFFRPFYNLVLSLNLPEFFRYYVISFFGIEENRSLRPLTGKQTALPPTCRYRKGLTLG